MSVNEFFTTTAGLASRGCCQHFGLLCCQTVLVFPGFCASLDVVVALVQRGACMRPRSRFVTRSHSLSKTGRETSVGQALMLPEISNESYDWNCRFKDIKRPQTNALSARKLVHLFRVENRRASAVQFGSSIFKDNQSTARRIAEPELEDHPIHAVP